MASGRLLEKIQSREEDKRDGNLFGLYTCWRLGALPGKFFFCYVWWMWVSVGS